ncbi:hypothetical protein L2E82_50542 [Cichorium intybus]|nr:hypothetical protein L2E82_50542 [Cichorium intybus]
MRFCPRFQFRFLFNFCFALNLHAGRNVVNLLAGAWVLMDCWRLMSFVAVEQFFAGAKLCSRKDLQLTTEGYECCVLKPGMLS